MIGIDRIHYMLVTRVIYHMSHFLPTVIGLASLTPYGSGDFDK